MIHIEDQAQSGAALSELDYLINQIENGGVVQSRQLLPFLCKESKSERCQINVKLATAFFKAENICRARVFAERAWRLSDYSMDVAQIYQEICAADQDFKAIRDSYKTLGMRAAELKSYSEALRHFTAWQYTYKIHQNLDAYEYDHDILRCIETMAEPYRMNPSLACTPGKKLRVAYLVSGLLEHNLSLIKINLTMAKWHDRSRFDIMFFAPESQDVLKYSDAARANVDKFKALGYDITLAPGFTGLGNSVSNVPALINLSRQIYETGADILVTCVGLSHFEYYFLACTSPAPILISLVQGSLPLCALPNSDWCIAWAKHPAMDTPVDCSLINRWSCDVGILSADERAIPIDRTSIGIPKNAILILSGGRHTKFQDENHWGAISSILTANPQTYYAITADPGQVAAVDVIVNPKVLDRIKFLGWRKDFLRILAASDIMIDTYPSGGGQTIFEAMRLGIPVVAHENDYWQLFDQATWCPIDEFFDNSELVVPRGDFKKLEECVQRLINDSDFRKRSSAFCRQESLELANSERAIRRLEGVYTRVYSEKKHCHSQSASSPAIIEKDPLSVELLTALEHQHELSVQLNQHTVHLERELDFYKSRWMKLESLPIVHQLLALRRRLQQLISRVAKCQMERT